MIHNKKNQAAQPAKSNQMDALIVTEISFGTAQLELFKETRILSCKAVTLCSSFLHLQELRTFAMLQSQRFCKIVNLFGKYWQMLIIFCRI